MKNGSRVSFIYPENSAETNFRNAQNDDSFFIPHRSSVKQCFRKWKWHILLLNCLTKRYKFVHKVLLLIFIGLGGNRH